MTFYQWKVSVGHNYICACCYNRWQGWWRRGYSHKNICKSQGQVTQKTHPLHECLSCTDYFHCRTLNYCHVDNAFVELHRESNYRVSYYQRSTVFSERPSVNKNTLQRHCFLIPTGYRPTTPQHSTVVGTLHKGSHKSCQFVLFCLEVWSLFVRK